MKFKAGDLVIPIRKSVGLLHFQETLDIMKRRGCPVLIVLGTSVSIPDGVVVTPDMIGSDPYEKWTFLEHDLILAEERKQIKTEV